MRYRWLLLFPLVLLAVLPTVALGQNDIRLHWEQYDTIVTINADGTMRVQEQQVLVVDQGPLRRMTREFVTGDQGQVRNIRVVEDGAAYRPGTETPGTYSGSDTGSEARIQLWFRDPNAAQHTFTIEYTVAGALVASGDQARLDWSFFWSSPNAPEIRAGSVEIRLPQQVDAASLRLDASGVPVELVSERNPIRWELTSPIQGSELDVQAAFPRALLAPNAGFRSAQRNTQPRAAQPPGVPGQVPGAAPAAGGFNIIFCLIVLFFLFVAFTVIRASAKTRSRRGYPPAYGPQPGYGPGPFAGPLPRGTRRRRHRGMGGWGGWGGWGGGVFPPIIINPPYQPRDQGGPFNSPFDGPAGGGDSGWGDSGGSSSSWGDSGGSSSAWGDSGGSSSSWGDMGGGGSSWGGGGDSGGSGGGNGGDNGGSGGGSFG